MIIPGDISKVEEILYKCYIDLIAYGKYFLAGDFKKSETPFFHYEIADELNSDSQKPLCIILPRGHAKTSLLKCSITHDFCYTRDNLYEFSNTPGSKLKEFWLKEAEKLEPLFYAWVAKSQKDSMGNVRFVSAHLNANPRIRKFFGEMRGKMWNKEDIVTSHGDRLISSSNLSSIRGKTEISEETLDSGSKRFTRVFPDDFETPENTKTQTARKYLKSILLADILPAIKGAPRCRIICVGTPVHFDSFIQNTLDEWARVKKDGKEDEYPWKVITYKATQPDMPGGVLWNSYIPRFELNRRKKIYEVKGELGLYYQEYELEVQSESQAKWTRQHIKFHNGVFLHEGGDVRDGDGVNYLIINGEKRVVNTFIGCEPATDIDTANADFSAIDVIAVDQDNNRYNLRYEVHRDIPSAGLRDDNGEIVGEKGVADYYIDMYDEFHCIGGSIEDVAMNRSMINDISKLKIKFNKLYIVANSVKPGGTHKLTRIYQGLNSWFSQGMIYIREGDYELIEQIKKFGAQMAHDDLIESFFIANKNAYPPQGYYRKEKVVDNEPEYYRKPLRDYGRIAPRDLWLVGG